MIIAQNLTRKFNSKKSDGITAVNSLSLHLRRGECVGLLGANGAGKTTLIRLISGFLAPTEGMIRVFGKDPLQRNFEKDSYIGLVSGQQFLGSYQKRTSTGGILPDPGASLKDNFELLGSIFHIPKSARKIRIRNVFEDFGLTDPDILEYSPFQLSLGQRMRAELAAVFFIRPALFLLDEPFIGVDASSRSAIRDAIRKNPEVCPESTILLATHDLAEAEQVCERILIMDKGALVYDGSLERLKKSRIGHHILQAVFEDELPNLSDLPIEKYQIDNRTLTIEYDPQLIGSAELTCFLHARGRLKDLLIRRPTLEEIVRRIHSC